MKTKRKIWAGIGVLGCIGAALWMRELASWRPVVVAKVGVEVAEMRISRDGRRLILQEAVLTRDEVILDIGSGIFDDDPKHIKNFDRDSGLETFPRVRLDENQKHLVFCAAPGQNIALEDKVVFRDYSYGGVMFRNADYRLRCAWSKARREVYGELGSEIWVWDWKSGKLKRRVRYPQSGNDRAKFSPDGKFLLTLGVALEVEGKENSTLRLYDVQTGKLLATPVRTYLNLVREYGFSPDGKLVWSTRVAGGSPNFIATRISNGEVVIRAESMGPVKWLADGRIGIVNENSFDWRDTQGNLLSQLPGPLQKGSPPVVTDWVLSPDGKWIYSAEQSGIIRRWRAG